MKNNVNSEVMMLHVDRFISKHQPYRYDDMAAYAKRMNVPSVSMFTGELLRMLVRMNHPKTVLELGCGIGLSTQYLLDSQIQHLDSIDLNRERLLKAKEFVKDSRVCFYNEHVATYLKSCKKHYDFVFVDTIKRDYLSVWYQLKPLLNSGAVLVFDDVLMYGYVANEPSEIPQKYQSGAAELKQFFQTIYNDPDVTAYTVPVADGVLVVQYDC